MDEGTATFLYIIGTLVGMFVLAGIFYFVLGVKKHLWYQRKQLDMLMNLCNKAGMTPEELQAIINKEV